MSNPDLIQFMQSQEKTNERLTEAITEIAKGQIELKVVQDEIKIISQTQRETQKEDAIELVALTDTVRNQTANIMELMKKESEVAISNSDYERLKADTHEKRADFNGKVAGWLLAVNVALTVSVVMLLIP